jgi:HD-GYP domain-containing protein (c-di-GMP phosphodiesterase class II)
MKIRFQNWVLVSTTLLVVLLAAAFLFTVFRTFATISEDNASTRFTLIGNQAAGELQGMLQASGRFVLTQTRGEADQLIKNGRIDPGSIVPLFVSGIETDATTYSYFIGLANEEFLQVIAIRDDKRIAEALKAPPEAHYAVRRILPDKEGMRHDYYHFYDKNRKPVGQRAQEARLIPTQRPWYAKAMENKGLAITDPYLFASTGELGITVAAPLPGGLGVLASDISLRSLREFLSGLALPPNGAIAVQDRSGKVLAFFGQGRLFGGVEIAPMTPPEKINDVRLQLLKTITNSTESQILTPDGGSEKFIITRVLSQIQGGDPIQVTVFAPLSDFTRVFDEAQKDVITLAVIVLLILLPLAIAGSRQVARSLEAMANDSERLKHLDFTHRPSKTGSFLYEVNALGEAQFVMHDAIVKRTLALEAAQKKLENLIESGLDLGREKDRNALLRKILWSGKTLLNADAGTMYVVTEHKTLRFAQRTSSDELPGFEIPLFDADGKKVERYMATWCVHRNEPIIVDDVYTETRFDTSGAKGMDAKTGYRTVSMLTVPLSPREGQVIGVLQFLNALDPDTGEVIPFSPELVRFVTAMAAQAAVALDNFQLIEAQKELMESLIKLIAGAIDAKSHYTGGHCERVPELGIMLAQAATDVKEGPLADFGFHTEEEWREFRIGAWLHDCGKVTTPEYVVDKACKLETIYNRIHEVRVRFEVLLRDARIAQLEAVAAGGDPQQALAAYEARKAQLIDDFNFIAECNLGGEFMAPEKVERLKSIAQQTWLRHFDDRAGLPHEELKRYPASDEALPVTEMLLADKPHHIIPRARQDVVDPKWGFKVTVPEHLYNYGEVYNLSVSRGTLTEEERFKINEHVMQSLMMLEQLPLPPSLKRVPEYAGTHHETLIGTGYPRKLTGSELSVPMRIMAIADIFEALTASDRPYKKAKTLSESIKILAFFKKDKHIDPDLFDLFLTSGVYREYAHKYLLPEQIDEVEIEKFIG